jgi:hypothetical protein
MPNKSFLQFVLFTAAYYHLDDYGVPIIELSCSPQAKELFFCIGKYHYFKYALENVINLTHKASYLLYIYILPNRYRGTWTISLEKLRDNVLDCKKQESYQEFKIFKNRVLDPAVKEINAKTDCHFEYEPIKRGRKVVEIKFTYLSKEAIDGQLSFDELPAPAPQVDDEEHWIEVYGSERLAILAEGCNYEFDKSQMEQISCVLTRIHIPKEANTNDLTFGKLFYLKEKYSALNAEVAKKKSNGEKNIKNRFRYFLKMLEQDTFHPAAYTE